MMKCLMRICLAAGATIAVPALAQLQAAPDDPVPYQVRPIDYVAATGYDSRAIGVVYSSGGPAGSNLNGLANNTTVHWADDVDFSCGPWAAAATRAITTVGIWVQKSGAACVGSTSFDINITIYDLTAFDFNANPMNLATPVFTGTGAVVNSACGVQTRFDFAMPTGGVPIAGNGCIMEFKLYNPGTTTLRPHPGNGGTQIEFPVVGNGNPAVTGGAIARSSPSYGNSFNADGIFQGGPIVNGFATGPVEHRSSLVSGTLYRQCRMQLSGDIISAPPASTPLGCIPDSGLSQNGSIAAGQVRWYEFCLNSDATLAMSRFLDIDTETSTLDAAIAVYNSAGTLMGLDDNDGSGTNAQLSFGICRRAAVMPDGLQYDGRDGDLVSGTYYIGVGPTGTLFSSGFTACNDTTATGNFTLNFATNTNGAALQPAVPPATQVDGDFGTLAPPGAQSAAAAAPNGVFWYKFTCGNIADPNGYLDVDISTLSAIGSNTIATLYDVNGNIMLTDQDDGADLHAQLSFGTVSPTRPGFGNAEPFDGRDGPLAAGTYYLCVSFPASTLNATRWCVRSSSTSNFPTGVQITTNVMVSMCHASCVADFDDGSGTGTPDGGVTIEDLLYYLALFDQGDPCADVDDGSATGTQDGGVTIEDLLYYLFRFDAGC